MKGRKVAKTLKMPEPTPLLVKGIIGDSVYLKQILVELRKLNRKLGA